MSICYKKKIFFNEVIKRFAKDEFGIYIIQKNNEIVFIGESGNLRKDILERLSSLVGHKIRLSFYSCNCAGFDPTARAEELLLKHRALHGMMPEFNENQLILNPCLLN